MSKVSSDQVITDYEGYVFVDTALGDVTLTLPTALGYERVLTIKVVEGNNKCICVAKQGETIDDDVDLVMNSTYDVVRLVSNGESWSVV